MSTVGQITNPGGVVPPEVTQVSSLPLPPIPYYTLYTDENVKKGRAPKPPPPPSNNAESYSMFGVQFRADDVIIRPLESQGIRRLYPQNNFDHRRELKKLNHSVVVNFLDLIDILIHCPESQKRQEKIDDINLLFIHIHHLINEFRPHQARETLRVMMEVQRRQTNDVSERLQKHIEKCVDIVRQALNSLPDQYESESKLLASTELFFAKNSTVTQPEEIVNPQDQMMCEIVDSM